MRLLQAYIENFGVLHEYHVTFERGVHVVCAPNGTGKTTFAAFLQAMFYGMPANTRRELRDNPRKKYVPWQGGTFGGWIEVETQQRVLRISRTFGARPKDDTLQLTDAATGRQIPTPEEGVGQLLFGLDEAAYARTVFMAQESADGREDSLHGQLRALLEGNNDPAAYTDAMRRLETARKSLQPLRGNGGRIGQLEQELADLGRIWAEASAEAETLESCMHTYDTLQHKLAEVRSARAACAAALDEAHRAAGGQAELRRQLDEAQAIFPGNVPTEPELTAAEAALNRLEMRAAAQAPSEDACEKARGYAVQVRETQEALNTLVLPPEVHQRGKELEEYFGGAVPSMTTVGQWEKQAQLLHKYKNIRFWLGLLAGLLCIMAVAAGLLGADLYVRLQSDWAWAAWGGGLLLLCGLLAALIGALRPRKKIQFLCRLLTPVQQKYNPDLPPEDAVMEAAEFRTEWEQIKAQVRSLKEERNRLAALRAEAQYGLDAFFDAYGRPEGTPEQAIAALRLQVPIRYDTGADGALLDRFWTQYASGARPEDPRRSLQQMRFAWDRIQQLNAALTEGLPAEDAAMEQHRRLQETDTALARLEEDVRQAAQRLESAKAAQRSAAELRTRHTALREQLHQMEHKRDLLDRTMQWMQEAQDQLSVQYLLPMRERFLLYFRRMFDTEAEQLTIDPDLHIVWTRSGGERPMSCFSDGTRTAAEVCIRLAMIDLLFQKERPVLILDDPFVYMDDDRLTRAMQVLSELGEETQILYFTCHTSRRGQMPVK